MAKTERAPNIADDVSARVKSHTNRMKGGSERQGHAAATVDHIANHAQGMHGQALNAVSGAGGMKMR